MAQPHWAMKVLIGLTGGIAAYKVCEVVSTLAKAEVAVRVIMTEQAQGFVAAVTFAALSRHPVYTDSDFWSAQQRLSSFSQSYQPLHIALGEWADVFLIAPLSANTLGKLAHGLADNLLTNTVLASVCPVLLAPAMNTDMWQQAVVQRNWQRLLADARYHAVGPGAGRLACDRIGTGRMAEPAEIVTHITSLHHTHGHRDLTSKHLLISTGSTQEYMDSVRFIGNPATGRMGIALAMAAQHRGAKVTLIHGPLYPELAQTLPASIQPIAVTTAAEMEQAMLSHLPQADWVIMAAAVADMRPAYTASGKLPKKDLPSLLPLESVPDIVAQLSARKTAQQKIVGFAAQTGEIVAPAIAKLKRKQLDVIVANPVDHPNSGFGSLENEAVIIAADGQQQRVTQTSKLLLAHQLYDFLCSSFS
ncbi:MAG: bifunctional phosphopantothenoylcysteine decarboxylase/phosphopantothenate--cysteine ligase CoaBC [Phormidesmis sp. RL_2_1]|nr:bifunctional phosphopantothenoylcysteine decarboxylase/phosphopantothenate--cysteine ligase CoaBC [Phormidesmis sp. RL_2_1]